MPQYLAFQPILLSKIVMSSTVIAKISCFNPVGPVERILGLRHPNEGIFFHGRNHPNERIFGSFSGSSSAGWVRHVLDSSVKEGSNIFISCFARRRSPSRGAYICTTRTHHKWAYLWRCNFNFEANVKPPI